MINEKNGTTVAIAAFIREEIAQKIHLDIRNDALAYYLIITFSHCILSCHF